MILQRTKALLGFFYWKALINEYKRYEVFIY